MAMIHNRQVDKAELNYELVRFLGNGAFGATFEAISTNTGDLGSNNNNRVAIKFIFPIKGGSKEGIKEIESYMKVAGDANSNNMTSISCSFNLLCFHTAGEIAPNSPQYEVVLNRLDEVNQQQDLRYTFDPTIPIYYIVTDFLEGSDLSKIIERGIEPSETELHNFLVDMLTALEYLRSKGLSHRDVKPANIIRTKNGRYVLIDFGLVCSKQICGNAGTISYMSNELILLYEAGLDVPFSMALAGDLFALALTFYEYAAAKKVDIPILKNGVYRDTDLPLLRLKSKLLEITYIKLLRNYNFIASDPTGISKLLLRL
jgi:serine/threonine protein kinase